jgi:hypothetical protein
MGNKLDFYKLLSQYGGGSGEERLLKTFQASHPGVLWRKVGKDEYQVKFRQSEGWQNLSSWLGNFTSSQKKALIDQVNRAKEIFSTEEILEAVDYFGITIRTIQKFDLSKWYVTVAEHEKVLSQMKELKSKLTSYQTKLNGQDEALSKERSRIQSEMRAKYSEELQSFKEEKSSKIRTIFETEWSKRKGVTERLNYDDLNEIFRQVLAELK